jgi:hypothetical protein
MCGSDFDLSFWCITPKIKSESQIKIIDEIRLTHQRQMLHQSDTSYQGHLSNLVITYIQSESHIKSSEAQSKPEIKSDLHIKMNHTSNLESNQSYMSKDQSRVTD